MLMNIIKKQQTMQTTSIKMRVLTEGIQYEVNSLYKDNNDCSNFRNVIPQKYLSQKDWPINLNNLFENLVEKGHTPIDACLKCTENIKNIQMIFQIINSSNRQILIRNRDQNSHKFHQNR